MSLQLTDASVSALAQTVKEPNIVLEIDGISTIFGAVTILRYALLGDDLVIGDPEVDDGAFYIGGLTRVSDQENAITLGDTSTSIRQSLNVDKGQVSSISNMSVALIDTGSITDIITPGNIIPDILGAKAKVYLGFLGWPDDYATIFRGVVTEVSADAGKVVLQINSPDDKKRTNIFKRVDTSLSGSITSGATTITLTSANSILQKITGPSGGIDAGFETYVKIENEIVKFTSISGNQLIGCSRGQLNSIAAAHSDGAEVSTFYVLSGNCVDVALKLLASGVGGYYQGSVAVASIGIVESEVINNAIYFDTVSIIKKYNVQVGDFVTTTGATNAGNNFSLREVTDIVETLTGSYLVVSGAALVLESDSPASISFRSQWDVWPDGMRLVNDEIDFDEHLRLQRLFLSNFNYTIYLKDTVEKGSDFLEEQIYSPVAAFSLPRKARASLGYHIGPIPGQDIKTLNETNIKSASKSKLTRSTSKNFYNEVVYKFDESAVEDKFLTGVITVSATSKNQIKTANKTMTIEAKGLRTSDLGESIATSQSNRRLDRYRFAAESIKIQTTFGTGFQLEVGDIVLYDGTNLLLPDIKNTKKGMTPRLFEINNKDINIKTGDISLELVDTSFDGSNRYCLMSPSSYISAGISSTQFSIKESFGGRFGASEYKKWENIIGASVRIRNSSYSQVSDSVITDVQFNTITVSPALSFVPSANMVLEFTDYDDSNVRSNEKLVYGHMKDTGFADGGDQYKML